MLELLLKVIDRLIELARIRERRLQARFEEIHKPTYEELKTIHGDYLMMFTELDQMLRAGRRQPTKVDEALEASIDFLSKRRVVYEPVRQKLLAFLDIFDNDQWPKCLTKRELSFIESVRRYMLANQQPFWGECYGPTSASTSLLEALRRARTKEHHFDIGLVTSETTDVCERLRARWSDVNTTFLKLKLALDSGDAS